MLAEIEARLTAQVPALKLVDGAVGFAGLSVNPPKSKQPAAYVIPITDSAGANAVANEVRQKVEKRFGVVLVLGNFKDHRGATASQQMEAIENSVINALLGWSPEADLSGCLYAGGRVVDFRDGAVWRLQEFTTDRYIGT